MLETIAHINAMYKEAITEAVCPTALLPLVLKPDCCAPQGRKPSPHLLNFVVSDGENVIATRQVPLPFSLC